MLDTNHLSELRRGGAAGKHLLDRLTAANDDTVITILPFDEAAAAKYDDLRTAGLRRIGSQDLMIAAITLNQNALLLSANLKDFRDIPNLRVEDWVHEQAG